MTGETEREEASFADDVARVARKPGGPWRSPLLMLAVIAVSGWLLWSFKPDLVYFFSKPVPVDLGHGGEYDLSKAKEGLYVKVGGIPSILKVQYKQLGTKYEVYYLLGSRIFIRQPLVKHTPGKEVDVYPTYDGSGRLLDLDHATQFINVRHFYATHAEFDFSQPAWIVLSGVKPRQQWIYVVGAVVVLLIGLLNIVLLLRWTLQRRS